MSVRCGNCKGDHDNVPQVRACYKRDGKDGHDQDAMSFSFNKERAPDGYYTVDFGDGEHRTIRLRTQSLDDSFAPGEQIAAYLSGPFNESDYTQFAFVKPDGRFHLWRRFSSMNRDTRIAQALKVVLKDPDAPAKLYAQRSGNCYVCGRTLTTPESIAKGIGPVCEGRAA